jgi:capsule polysaccharide export protein KpsC/LpsZ
MHAINLSAQRESGAARVTNIEICRDRLNQKDRRASVQRACVQMAYLEYVLYLRAMNFMTTKQQHLCTASGTCPDKQAKQLPADSLQRL